MRTAFVLAEDRLDHGEELAIVEPGVLMDRDRRARAVVEGAQPTIVGGDGAILDRKERRHAAHRDGRQDLLQALGPARDRQLVFHLVEARLSRARIDPIRAVDARAFGGRRHEQALQRAGERRKAMRQLARRAQRQIDRQVDRGRLGRHRVGRRLVEDLHQHVGRGVEGPELEVAMRVDQLLDVGQHLRERRRVDVLAQRIPRTVLHAELRHDPERAHRGAGRVEDVGVARHAALDDVAGGGHEPNAAHRRRERPERDAGAVGARPDGAAERLLVDVTLIREGLAELPERVAERLEARAGPDRRLRRRVVVLDDAGELVERDERIVGRDQRAERMPGADHADRSRRPPHLGREIGLVGRNEPGLRTRGLAARPVHPRAVRARSRRRLRAAVVAPRRRDSGAGDRGHTGGLQQRAARELGPRHGAAPIRGVGEPQGDDGHDR